MPDANDRDFERELILAAAARLRTGIVAATLGLLAGTGLFVATVWLLVKGGPNVGKHLSLLANYFPGYRVSVAGAFIGLLYGALTGAVVGWAVAGLYNRITGWRERRHR